MESQKTARSRLRGLLKDLTSSPEYEARHLLEWLEAFSKRLMTRADEVTAGVHKLVESTEVVEQRLHNTFNSFRGLSSTQFVENHVFEEDETMFIHQATKIQDEGIPSQSYEDDIVPRYREAIATAWDIYEQHICKPHKKSSGPHKSRMLTERWHKQLPHIIGTEDFMRDNSCGLAEDRSTGMETFEFESDGEREATDLTENLTNAGSFLETEQSGSESDDLDVQVGSFEPAVSAALDFKAMLEAALRSSYIPYNDGMLSSNNGSIEQLAAGTVIPRVSEEISRSISKEGRTILQPDLKMDELPQGPTQNSTIPKKHFKVAPSFSSLTLGDATELHYSSDPTESQKVFSPKKLDEENEHIAKSSHEIVKFLPGSATGRGLFDDENEEGEFLGFSKDLGTSNSWSNPTIPDGLFNHVRSSLGHPNVPIKKEIKATKTDLSHSPSTSHKDLPAFPSAENSNYGLVHDLFSLQPRSGGIPLRESLSVFRKGLFDNDDDINKEDSGDLFGSSSTLKDAQSFQKTNDLLEDSKGKAVLSQEKQKSNLSRDEAENCGSSISPEGSVVESKEVYSGRDKSQSSSNELQGGRVINSLEHVSNSKDLLLLPSDKDSMRALNSDTTEEKLAGSHHLGTQRNLNAVRESDDGVDSWSSASSIPDSLPPENMAKNIVQSLKSSVRNGSHNGESESWSEKDEGIGLHLPEQSLGHELNSFSYSEASDVVIDASAFGHKEKMNETDLDHLEEVLEPKQCVAEEEAKNVSSEWSRAKSLLQEHLNLRPFRPSLQGRVSVLPSKEFMVDAGAGSEDDNDFQDVAHLHHATMSRPKGSSRRRGPTSVRKFTLHKSDIDATRISPVSSTEVEQTAAFSPEKQEPAMRVETVICDIKSPKSSEKQALDSTRLQATENEKWAQTNYLDYLSKQADAAMQASSASRDAKKPGDRSFPVMSTAVTKFSPKDDTVDPRYLEGKNYLKRPVSSPKQETEEALMKYMPTVVNYDNKSLNSILFGDENDNNEVDLFGPVQGSTLSSSSNTGILVRNQGKGQSLFGSDEETPGNESKVSSKKGLQRSLTGHSQGPSSFAGSGPLRKSAQSSLFDEADDDDLFT